VTSTTERPSSIWEGSDHDFLAWAIPFYLRGLTEDPRILDATWGLGTFWRGGSGQGGERVGLDIDGRGNPAVLGDNKLLPFRDESFTAVVFDPPHLSDVGGSSQYRHRYGSSSGGSGEFLSECQRVLVRGGVLLAKLADQVHGGESQWTHVDFINQVEATRDLVVCDLIIKVRASAMNDPKWKHVWHARKHHSFWIVCRKGEC
jgi:hypothetical protein